MKIPGPIFIPKIQDTTAIEVAPRLQAVILEAHTTEWRPGIVSGARAASEILIIDPVTDHLLFKDSSTAANFKKLGYPEMEPERIYSDSSFRRNELVNRALAHQDGLGADWLIAPFLYAEDTDDTKFTTNLSMAAESIQYIRDGSVGKPLFAMVHIGNTILRRPTVLNYVVDRYKDFEENLAGYILTINELDARSADHESLLGLAYLTHRFSENRPVFIKHIGAFGEVLAAVGANGFISGLGAGETPSVKHLQEKITGPRKRHMRTYIPEIFGYVNDEEAKKIKYTCTCLGCNGSMVSEDAAKKVHILLRRTERMEKLSGLSPSKRVDMLESQLAEALRLVGSYQTKHALPFKSTHLVAWSGVLKQAKHWGHGDAQDCELEELIKELETGND